MCLFCARGNEHTNARRVTTLVKLSKKSKDFDEKSAKREKRKNAALARI